ncbi:hypothetical protein BH09PAT1_BH09PAT1_0200 [soil metagenome]
MKKLQPILFLMISGISLFTLVIHTSFQKAAVSHSARVNSNVVVPSMDLKIVAIEFYSQYDTCLRSKASRNLEAVTTCQEQNSLVSQSIKVDRAGNEDSFICSSELPLTYEVKDVTKGKVKSSVKIIESFTKFDQTIVLELGKEKGSWKILRIICPSS